MPQSAFTIFHATDLHPDGGTAFEHSVAMAHACGAKLFTVHARTPFSGDARREMPDAGPLLRSWGTDATVDFTPMQHECCDDPVDTLLDAVGRVHPDLLVVGTHQKTGLDRLLHDSVSNALAVNALVPTLFLPIGKQGFVAERGELAIRRILVPIGSHDAFAAAVPAATQLAQRLGLRELEFHLLHVGEPGVLEDELVPEHPGWSYFFEDVDGDLQSEMVAHCEQHDIDLIVMATHGQDGLLDVLRGTRTQQALRATSCPMLVVPM